MEQSGINKDGKPMILIPAGWFTMGTEYAACEDEAPVDRVYLDAFYMILTNRHLASNVMFHKEGDGVHLLTVLGLSDWD